MWRRKVQPGMVRGLALLLSVLALVSAGFAQEQNYPQLLELGLREIASGHFQEAEVLLVRAQDSALARQDAYAAALARTGLGELYQSQHRFLEAEQAYHEAIPVFRQSLERRRPLAMALRSLGAAYSGQQRYADALRVLIEASELASRLPGETQLKMQVLTTLGIVNLRQGDLGKAESLFVQAARLQPPAGSKMTLDIAGIFSNLGLVYANRHQNGKAEASYKQALDALSDGSGASNLLLASVHENLGSLYLEMKRYEDAEAQFLASLDLINKNNDRLEDVRIQDMHGLSRVYIAQGKNLKARAELAQATEIGRSASVARQFLPNVLETYSALLTEEAKDLNAEAKRVRAEFALTVRAPKADKQR